MLKRRCSIFRGKTVLIETYWNVNGRGIYCHWCVCLVLIETYWNVNPFVCCPRLGVRGVLIETYWNVNLLDNIAISLPMTSLNRNILECKS